MQTFLPYSDFVKSAECLDMRRLGKQRVETWQIYNALTQGNRWKNHPAVKMWRGYEKALLEYGIAICEEWVKRGYKDSLLPKFKGEHKRFGYVFPIWLGKEIFHASHRSNLLRKDPIWYGKFGWLEPNNLPYIWPVK